MPNLPELRKRSLIAAASATVLFAGGAVALQQAGAQPVDSKIAATCMLGTNKLDVSVPLTVDDKTDPATEGGSELLETKTGLPALPVEVTVNKLVVTDPVPAQVASVDKVTFVGGNMKSSYTVSGSNIIVTFTGPVSSKDIQVPTVDAALTLKSGIAGSTISWKTFSEVDADTNYGPATCTPNDPSQEVNSTKVNAAPSTPPTTTEPTPTTTPGSSVPTTPTTKPAPTSTTTKSGAAAGGSVNVSGPGGTSASGSGSGSLSLPGTPATPAAPSIPGAPSVPVAPSAPGAPSLPAPGAPAVPVPVPSAPGTPTLPAAPTLPGAPTTPTLPKAPLPGAPTTPTLPKAPALPKSGVSVSVTGTATVHPGAF